MYITPKKKKKKFIKLQFFKDSVYVSQRETKFLAYGELKCFWLAIQNQTQVAIIGIL